MPSDGRPISVIVYRLITRPRSSLGTATWMKVGMIVPEKVLMRLVYQHAKIHGLGGRAGLQIPAGKGRMNAIRRHGAINP